MRRFTARYASQKIFPPGCSQSQRAQPRPATQSLYDVLKAGKNHPEVLVNDWLKSYKDNQSESLSELFSLFLQSCGLSQDCVTLEDLETREMDDIIEKITSEVKEQEEYPIQSRQKAFKNFNKHFESFWAVLITNANDTIFDGILLNFTINWLASLSFSKLRPIRHTATLAVLAMGQSLVEFLDKDKRELERVEMFIEAETKKDDSARLNRLREQHGELLYRLNTIHDVVDTLFKEVLCHRCKDVMTEIRTLACSSLGFWADKYPSRYLEEATMKIFGLLIFDKAGDVREQILMNLINLYKNHDDAEVLGGFTEKFKGRVIECCHDVELRCCEYAIELVTIFAGNQILTEDEANKLSYLMWADNVDIRHAASEFVIEAKFGNLLPQPAAGAASYEGKDIEIEKALLNIVQFFKDFSDGHMFRVELLVDSFWKKTSAVRNWTAMCELLHRGNRTNATELELEQRLIIVHMLIASAKKADASAEKRSKQRPGAIFTTVLMQYLPELLTIYRHDTEVMRELAKIPALIDLNTLATKDMKGSFMQILAAMADIFLQSTDYDILIKIAQAFGHLCKTPHTMQTEAQGEFAKIITDSVKMFSEQLNLYTLDDENVLEIALSRVASILYVQDILDELEQTNSFPGTTKFIDDILGIVSNYATDSIPGNALVRHAITALYLSQLWYLNRVTKSPELIEGYIDKRDAIVEALSICVALMGEVKDLAFQMLVETLVIVSGHPASNSPLHYDVQPVLVSTIEDYMYSIELRSGEQMVITPVNAKQNATKLDAGKEDATKEAALTCFMVGRLISNCPSITMSQLASSFFAHYGPSQLKTIQNTVKSILTNFKNKDAQQSGPFKERNLFYAILLDSMIKAFGTGERAEIVKLKELAKKLSSTLGNTAMRPKMADRFKAFLLEAINFAFSEVQNYSFFEPMIQFLKPFLAAGQYREVYERTARDSERIQENENYSESQLYPLRLFEFNLARMSNISINAPKVPTGWNKRAANQGNQTDVKPHDFPLKDRLRIEEIKKCRTPADVYVNERRTPVAQTPRPVHTPLADSPQKHEESARGQSESKEAPKESPKEISETPRVNGNKRKRAQTTTGKKRVRTTGRKKRN